MIKVITSSAAQTRAFGENLAGQLRRGDVLLLFGQMGAGKSELARGIAKGLGVIETVASPTFPLLQAYHSGSIPLYHFDCFRIGDVEELYELSMDEYLGGDGIAVVEWPEQVEAAIPSTYLRVGLTPVGEDLREIVLEPVGGFHILEGFPEGLAQNEVCYVKEGNR